MTDGPPVLFPTITFAIFFLVVYVASWLLMPHRRLWKWTIIAASYVFYGWWDWRFVLLLIVATFVNQALALQVRKARRRSRAPGAGKWWVAAAVLANLGALGYFKYYGFFVANVQDALSAVGVGADLPLLHIVLPVGISFLVFRISPT